MSSPLRSIEEMRANIDKHPKSIIEQTSQAVSNLDNLGRKLNAVAHVAKDDSIARAKKGWTCIYHDFTSDIMIHVSFKWIITTHTLYDSELNNREIITLEDRNRFIRR